ncbi:ABC transporter permease [uncultured Paludibaculum sp.]|uniref:ABC transporter permease n=1 Tax=uncultured Paludibaculum sp. TaxID=1765020 RepID=UPI002AAA8B5F|nr:ABC transporter permease [uncultured Paludibaculum sp.]
MRMEHWWYTLPLRLKSILLRRRVERELDEELQFHLEHKVEEGIAQGLSAAEARYRALRAMDGLEQRKEEIRDTRHVLWLTDLLDDVQYAMRSLRRTPGLTAFVVMTLALGIGMTATPFSMLDALVFRPYPVRDPGSVMTLVSTSRDNRFDSFSYREYLDVRDHTASYDGVIASLPLGAAGFSAKPGATPVIRGAMPVSGNYFQVLGVEPRIGRGFRPEEDMVPGRDAVVVLAADFWKREFAGDPGVVGRTVRLNGMEFTVIGVAPESFPGMLIFSHPDFYVPLAMAKLFSANPRKDFFVDRDERALLVRARLKAGVTKQDAQNELTVLARGLEREYPKYNRERGAEVHTQFEMRTRGDDVNWKFSVIFTMLAVGVLLVACTNAAGLLLSRARTRTREIAVRLALGAGRFRLIRLLLTESLVLAGLGGVGGIAVGYIGIQLLQRFEIPADLPVTVPFRMDTRVLVASLAMSVLCALFCGLAPAMQSSRADLVNGLKAADVDLPGRKRLWGRNALVVAQIAMSLMLLAASFLMVRGFQDSVRDTTEFSKTQLLMVRFDPRLMQYSVAQTQGFYRLLAERLRGAPGIESTAFTQNPPLGMDDFDNVEFVPDGFEMPRDRESFQALMDTVDEGYFETMGVPITRGRGFAALDTAEAPRVAVVNEHFAKHYWPNADAVGQHIRLGGRTGEPVRIVGIARPVKYKETFEGPRDFVYLPLAQHPVARMVLLLRSSGDPLELVQPVKDVVQKIDANMPIVETRTYQSVYRYSSVEGPQVAINLVGTFGAVGLLLAMAGLYGLVAYNVSRRTREIGIRIAIGASQLDVLRLVMGQGLVLVGVGTVIGLVLGFAVERLLNAMLFNAGGVDVVAYLVVVPVMLLVTTIAAYVPARSAARIAPTRALRYE